MADFKQTGPFSRQSAEYVERLPGQFWGALQGIGRNLGRTGKYLSSEKAAQDYTKLVSGQLPVFGRPAAAGTLGPNPLQGDPTGRYIPGGGTPWIAAADIGGDGRSDEARALASQYAPKPFAFTPEGQFERYFKTPEMDQYFGTASRGAAAPKDVEAMKALAGKTVAPGKTPEELSAFYRAESAMGRAQMPQIQEALRYKKDSDLAKWAEANPMLAQRLYAKEMGRREAAGQVTPGVTYAGAPAQPLGDESFSVAAKSVPAPWNTQGAKVSGEFADVMPFQAAKTTGEGMPSLPTTLNQRAEELISTFKRDRGML
jgi:hypothetical protein